MIQLSDPGPVMEVTQDVSVILGDCLTSRDKEASTARRILLEGPAVRAVVGVLHSYM